MFQYRVRLSDTLRDSNSTIFVGFRPEGTADYTVATMPYFAMDGDFITVPAAVDPFGVTAHSAWEVRIATDAGLFTLLPTVTEDHVSQLVDDVQLNIEIAGINEHIQQIIDGIDLSAYTTTAGLTGRLVPLGQNTSEILRATGDDLGNFAWQAMPDFALAADVANRLVPATGTDDYILKRTGTAAGAFGWEAETQPFGGSYIRHPAWRTDYQHTCSASTCPGTGLTATRPQAAAHRP